MNTNGNDSDDHLDFSLSTRSLRKTLNSSSNTEEDSEDDEEKPAKQVPWRPWQERFFESSTAADDRMGGQSGVKNHDQKGHSGSTAVVSASSDPFVVSTGIENMKYIGVSPASCPKNGDSSLIELELDGNFPSNSVHTDSDGNGDISEHDSDDNEHRTRKRRCFLLSSNLSSLLFMSHCISVHSLFVLHQASQLLFYLIQGGLSPPSKIQAILGAVDAKTPTVRGCG